MNSAGDGNLFETSSNGVMVGETGLEPARVTPRGPKPRASANSATRPNVTGTQLSAIDLEGNQNSGTEREEKLSRSPENIFRHASCWPSVATLISFLVGRPADGRLRTDALGFLFRHF